jgi:hypothetical protein
MDSNRTVRQALIEWGWQDLIPATHSWVLDHTHVGAGFPTPVVANDDPMQAARLFVVCGGDVLFKLPGIPPYTMGGSIYVVRCDELGKAWEAERRRHADANGVVQYFDGYHSPRPGPYLRIVVTA